MPDNDTELVSPKTLATCPSSPNCVCSTDVGRDHYIAPLAISGDVDTVWLALRQLLEADDSIKIMSANETVIRAEAKTRILRFTDDVEFLLNRAESLIHMRSASRVGYSDLGKNRKRLEVIRDLLGSATP